jgi:uncharacterized protein (TIGR02145 family)
LHFPVIDEWYELINTSGGLAVAGGKMKETGTTRWKSPNTGATDESGFTALPAGRYDLGTIYDQRGGAFFLGKVAIKSVYSIILRPYKSAIQVIGVNQYDVLRMSEK